MYDMHLFRIHEATAEEIKVVFINGHLINAQYGEYTNRGSDIPAEDGALRASSGYSCLGSRRDGSGHS